MENTQTSKKQKTTSAPILIPQKTPTDETLARKQSSSLMETTPSTTPESTQKIQHIFITSFKPSILLCSPDNVSVQTCVSAKLTDKNEDEIEAKIQTILSEYGLQLTQTQFCNGSMNFEYTQKRFIQGKGKERVEATKEQANIISILEKEKDIELEKYFPFFCGKFYILEVEYKILKIEYQSTRTSGKSKKKIYKFTFVNVKNPCFMFDTESSIQEFCTKFNKKIKD